MFVQQSLFHWENNEQNDNNSDDQLSVLSVALTVSLIVNTG